MVWEIREYGAVDDGRTVNTAVIQNTIDRCHQAGGGTVLIEGGVYLCGTIFAEQCYAGNRTGNGVKGKPRHQ